MSIMGNKVTRRIALGSIAGGLGGAALVLRALKGRYDAKLSEGKWTEVKLPPGMVLCKSSDYEAEWAHDLQTVDVPVKEISGPSTFTMQHKPVIGDEFRMVCLNTVYDEHSYPAKFPQLPFMYYRTVGQVEVVPPPVDEKAAFSIVSAGRAGRARHIKRDEPGGECILVSNDGGADYFQIKGGTPETVPAANVNASCSVIGSQLVFDYPKSKTLSIRSKWFILQQISGYEVELPCEIVGFAEVAGRKAVKVLAEKHLTKQDYNRPITERMQTLTKIAKPLGNGVGPKILMKKGMLRTTVDARGAIVKLEQPADNKEIQITVKDAIQEGDTQTIRLVCYVDLETGIPMRRELTEILRCSKSPKKDKTTVSIGQVLEG